MMVGSRARFLRTSVCVYLMLETTCARLFGGNRRDAFFCSSCSVLSLFTVVADSSDYTCVGKAFFMSITSFSTHSLLHNVYM